MEDITDSSVRALFDNLEWFSKKMCSVMTSASACEHMWSITGWIHSKRRNRLAQPTVEKAVRAHDNLVLRKAMIGGSGIDSSDGDNDGDDQHQTRHNPVMTTGIQSSPVASNADHLTRPMRQDLFGRILRKIFEGQQPLPWALHPVSVFMNTEAYRRFNYCASSGKYTAFEVSGNAAVYLASFTTNTQPDVRL